MDKRSSTVKLSCLMNYFQVQVSSKRFCPAKSQVVPARLQGKQAEQGILCPSIASIPGGGAGRGKGRE